MRPKRRFGQHFLIDTWVIEQIIDAFGPLAGERIVEIGPGRGALTRALLAAGMRVDAIEIDAALVAALAPLAGRYPTLRIHHADALQLELADFTSPAQPLRLIGNLPYDISTPLLLRLCAQRVYVRQITVMLQQEIVDRIVAAPGTKTYGRLSVAVQVDCAVERLFEVPPEAFTPPPRVHSSMLTLYPQPDKYPVADRTCLDNIVRAAFSQRRKTLRNALAGVVRTDQIERAGIDPGARAEEIGVDAFVRLANSITADTPVS